MSTVPSWFSRAMRLRDVHAAIGRERVEKTAYQDLAVRLQRDGIDIAPGRIRVEADVERAIRMEPGNAIARDGCAAVGRKRAKATTEK